MKISWKREPAPFKEVEDESITTPVYAPRGMIDTNGDGFFGEPDRERRTHARDTINVHPESAGIAVSLDDGSGFGYQFPMPCDSVTLKLRRKGQRAWIMDLETVSAQYGSTLDIRFSRKWYELPPGYYEVKIVFRSGDRVSEGGWLLLHKDATPSALTTGARQVRRKAMPSAPIGHDIEGEG